MPSVPLAPWTPDQGPLVGGTVEAMNVVPISTEAYGPVKQLITVGITVGGVPVAMTCVEGTGGHNHIYVGTNTNIYLNQPEIDWTWQTVGSGYSTQDLANQTWRFTQYKNLVIATNGVNKVQYFNQDAGNIPFGDLSEDAPGAVFSCVTNNFLVLGNVNDPVGGLGPYRIWWSAYNDIFSWPTPGTAAAQAAQSDYNDFAGGGGQIRGLVSNLGNAEMAIFFQHSVWRGTYVGPPDVFDFTLAVGAKGCFSSRSVVTLGALVYYLGEDGFYTFDGAYCQPIGYQKIDRWFWDNVNPLFVESDSVIGGYDAVTHTVRWIFPSKATGRSTTCDTMLMYQPETQRWTHGSISAVCISQVLTIPSQPQPQMGAMTPGGVLGFFTGANASAEVTTVEAEISPGTRAFVGSARPLCDGSGITVAVNSRYSLGDVQTIGPDQTVDVSGDAPQRVTGRYLQAVIKMPLGSDWTKAEGVEFDGIAAGKR